uniref:START domain-containing protein n=1 Tax=Panagrolaimus sp. ES5 TaxID=591445 RepID=A0AC34G2Q4_9BILA
MDPDFQSRKDWKIEIDNDNVKIHSKHYPFGNAALPASMEVAFEESYNNFENMSTWNSNICYTKMVTRLTEHADIIHYANPDVMIVKSRDYVVGRLWRKIGDELFCAARSVELDDIPETSNRVRGRLHLGCGKFTPDKLNPNITHVEYVLCIDLKGYIPKYIINAVMGKMMVKDFEETLKRYHDIAAEGQK